MAGAGKKLQGGGARTKRRSPAAQVSDGGYGRPGHPLRLLPGQVFFPRSAHGRRRPFVVVRESGGRVRCERLDGGRERLSVSSARLLERGSDGRAGESGGRWYVFQGYRARRYRTWAYVASVDAERAVVVVPEWHPGRPVTLPARVLPVEGRERGGWLEVTVDLSAANPARLQLAPLRACEPPAADVCPEPRWKPAAGKGAVEMAEFGPGCGDIVLELPSGIRDGVRRVSVFVAERPEGIGDGSRVYVPDATGRASGWLSVVFAEVSPSGYWLYCQPELHRLPHPVAIRGVREARMWRWRWWPRDAEKDAGELARYEYEPGAHRGGYVWRNRREAGS